MSLSSYRVWEHGLNSSCQRKPLGCPRAGDALGRMQKARVLAEPDVLRLIISSTMPEAPPRHISESNSALPVCGRLR